MLSEFLYFITVIIEFIHTFLQYRTIVVNRHPAEAAYVQMKKLIKHKRDIRFSPRHFGFSVSYFIYNTNKLKCL